VAAGTIHESGVTHPWRFALLVFLLALVALGLAMTLLHALDSGLSGSDEGSHFLNGYLIWSYLTEALGRNPLAYATDFYAHYPKISIGHWPPLYYVFLGALFFVLPHVPMAFLIVNLVVSATPALIVGRWLLPILGRPWALLGGLLCIALPISLANSSRLMLDQALAAICMLAAALWSTYSRQRSLSWALGFALVAAAAILTKGNGWLLVMFVPIHVALTGRWSLLWRPATSVAAALALALVGAWTVATYKISSDGFNYRWGLDYFALALPTFLRALYANLGPLGTALAMIGIWSSLTARDRADLQELGRTGLALVLATLFFHAVAPVDLDPRYMTSAVFPLAIFMTIGVWRLAQRLRWASARPGLVVAVALMALSIPSVQLLRQRPARVDLGMAEAAQWVSDQPAGIVVVVDGNPGVEGSLISEVALRDRTRQHYVVRSSQLLARSDFMGRTYVLKAETPQEVLNMLDDVSATAVVAAEGPQIEAYDHNQAMKSALQDPASPFQIARVIQHKRGKGYTTLYVRAAPLAVDRQAVRRVSFPEKAPK
jgi:hypothetical protein